MLCYLVPTVSLDPLRPDPGAIRRAARLLLDGGIVAFPTETVYGLGAHALDAAAVRRVFAAKGRPAFNPLIVHVADAAAARAVVAEWPPKAELLSAAFWPGPLTLVLRRGPTVPDEVTAGLDTVAVRVPGHPVALALLREVGVPVAAPSANPFARLSPTTAGHVERGLGEAADLILDAGATPVGIESTVVDLTREPPVILRPGAVTAAELERVVGPLAASPQPGGPPRSGGEGRDGLASPGLLERHYAPRAELRLFGAEEGGAAADAARVAAREGRTVGGLLLRALEAPIRHVVPMPQKPAAYARLLYSALHGLDDAGCDLVLVEAPPESPEWAGVLDRLRRAARRPDE